MKLLKRVIVCFRGHACTLVYVRSFPAYEKALAVASSEKEKACILTALALIQHMLGSLDHAKTLLFKW